ncbi:nucleic acid binding protein [Trifolium pratense]|uniref:Nucleic acid binding protein n=1 Tax=Trifolium pratense TaxID=57577 RepID=A0A2K3L0K8_TRIPR|nr:nucleic acid binding protein [Trifolium pratense]
MMGDRCAWPGDKRDAVYLLKLLSMLYVTALLQGLNTDGARKKNGCAGCGGLIPGCDKEWLGGFSKFLGQCSVYVAALWGVYEGLNFAQMPGFHKVEVCVDSRAVYSGIHNDAAAVKTMVQEET